MFVGADANESTFQIRATHPISRHSFRDPCFRRCALPGTVGGCIGACLDHRGPRIASDRDLNLRADLVTLSACNAGAGRPAGIQGLESLVSAFQFAGARSVLASRWVTEDTFAASLMTDIYRELAAGFSAADALGDAQLTALRKFGNPGVDPLELVN